MKDAELNARLEPRAACKRIVGILTLAARAECERALGAYLLCHLAVGQVPSLLQLERRFEPRNEERSPDELLSSGGFQHPLALYDALLSPSATEIH